MIDERDVITVRLPFPDISSTLAVQAHMYICNQNKNGRKKLLKAQTYKANLEKVVDNFVREYPDINRNPFNKVTMIDLDKRFCIDGVTIPTTLRTRNRCDVSQEVYDDICNKIQCITDIFMDVNEFLSLNEDCYR